MTARVEARRHAAHQRRLGVDANARAGAWRARAPRRATSSSRRTSSTSSSAGRPSRARSTRSPTSSVRSSSCALAAATTRRARARAGPSRGAQQLDVRADRRQRRAQLVRGVGDELALGLARASSAASIVLNARARRSISSSPPDGMRRDRSWVAATCSAVAVSRAHRRDRARARRARAQPAGERDAAEADGRAGSAQPLERAVDLGERARATSISPSTGPAVTKTRRCVAVDARGPEERAGRARRDRAGLSESDRLADARRRWARRPGRCRWRRRTTRSARAPRACRRARWRAGLASSALAEHLHARHDRAQPVVDLAAQHVPRITR